MNNELITNSQPIQLKNSVTQLIPETNTKVKYDENETTRNNGKNKR